MYVLTVWWSTPGDDGYDIVGLFTDLHAAQDRMRRSANEIKEEYPDDLWEDSYSKSDDMCIHIGFGPKEPFLCSTMYNWDIYDVPINDTHSSDG